MRGKLLVMMLLALLLSAGGGQLSASQAPAPALATPSIGGCFVAEISGAHEVPPNNNTIAAGTAVFLLSPDRSRLSFHIEYSNLSAVETAAYIHKGGTAQPGPPVVRLPSGNPKDGWVTLGSTFTFGDLAHGQLYVNIFSASAPDVGEIRGQIVLSGGCFAAVLSGGNATPPNESAAGGIGIFALWPDKAKLSYYVGYSGLSGAETGAHIHKGAAGAPGDIVFDLSAGSPIGSPKEGTLALGPAFSETDLLAGALYVDVHSTAFPDGEIRGQIAPISNCFVARLSGANVVPPNTYTSRGSALFVLSPDRTRATYRIEYSGLSTPETKAHIHRGRAGTIGDIVVDLSSLSPAGSPKRGLISFDAPLTLDDFLSGELYVDIHSSNFPGGELRGQIAAGACTIALPLVATP